MANFIDESLIAACGLVATEAILRGYDPEEVLSELATHYSSIYDDENMMDLLAGATEACFQTLPKLIEHLGIIDSDRGSAIYAANLVSKAIMNLEENGEKREVAGGHALANEQTPVEAVKAVVESILLNYSVSIMLGKILISDI